MKKNSLLIFLFSFISVSLYAQSGVIKGRVFSSINNESVPFANVIIQGQNKGTSTDVNGNYKLENLEPGLYNLEASFIGFEKAIVYEVAVTNARATTVDIPLKETATKLEGIEITASSFTKSKESPVSVRTIGAQEIERFPGANRDISKVIAALPGVAPTVSFRNDIIIRGGSPNENRFYLDGIEVPNINHFATQGASGGPVGLLNVNFIREVDFYSGAFPANRGNALSSVFEFKQKDGNPDQFVRTFTVGSSDIGLTFDGPVTKKSTIIFSARRSYLQFLFAALKLPFLPTYNDAQFKYKWNINEKNQLSVIGLGAIDQFALNTQVNDGVTDPDLLERNRYFLGNIPVNEQWNYTVGLNYTHFTEKSYQTFVVSRNHLNNSAVKYANNDDSSPDNLILNYKSQEIENKFRFEHTVNTNGYKINGGIGYEYVTYTNSTFNKIFLPTGAATIDYNSRLDLNKFAAFGQISKGYLSDKISLSLGIRSDINTYSGEMMNPIDQLSPRFSFSWNFAPRMSFNANVGRYSQLPAYTVLGFRNNAGDLVNKQNKLTYIHVEHLVAGLEYNTEKNAKFTLEGFYKNYNNYPFLLLDSISLANLGGDFGVVGDRPVNSTSQGRSYGIEFLAQQKLYKGFFGILAYTFVVSEFKDKNGQYISSSWDTRHIVSLTGGKKFKKNWDVGARWLFSGGAPYTPFDIENSAQKAAWDVRGQGILDYNRLNTLRLGNFNQLDIRVDKKYFFEKWSLNLYLDIQNVYNFQAEQPAFLNVRRDGDGNPLTDPNNPAKYQIYTVDNFAGTLVPTIGIIVEF